MKISLNDYMYTIGFFFKKKKKIELVENIVIYIFCT